MVQITPPGSACSRAFGVGVSDEGTGAVKGPHLVVNDIEAARSELAARGASVSEVRHVTGEGWKPGPDPDRGDYNSFAECADPDGNGWVLQEVGHSPAS